MTKRVQKANAAKRHGAPPKHKKREPPRAKLSQLWKKHELARLDQEERDGELGVDPDDYFRREL